MAYFPNGTSGMIYVDQWCSRCTNWKDLDDGRGCGCPIQDLHLAHNYDQVKNEDIKMILETFIPTKEDGFPDKCLMFTQAEGEIVGQMHFEDLKVKHD